MTEVQTRFTTEGLVIKEMNIGESDRLVTLFTRDFGIIRAFAAGAKNIKSKKAAATSLLTYSSFTVLKKGGSYRIYEATPISQFFAIGNSIDILFISQYFCELALCFGEEETPNEELLRLILNSLHFLTKEKRYPFLIKAITEFRVAATCGYKPDLIACNNCGKFESNIMYFSYKEGILFCNECKPQGEFLPLNKTMVSAMRHIVYSDISKLYAFEIPDDDADKLSKITQKYITEQTDYRFSTLTFIEGVANGV